VESNWSGFDEADTLRIEENAAPERLANRRILVLYCHLCRVGLGRPGQADCLDWREVAMDRPIPKLLLN
jgi:hypothetical protein